MLKKEAMRLRMEKLRAKRKPPKLVNVHETVKALSDDNEQVDSWLKTQPNPVEVHNQYDYEFIKKQLQNYLNPGSVEETTTTSNTDSNIDTSLPTSLGQEKVPAAFSTEAATAGKKDRVAEFNDLFKE